MQKNISSCTFQNMSDLNHPDFMQMKSIGHIKSCYPDKFGIPRQSGIVNSVFSELIILPEWQPEQALIGLNGYSHMWVIFIFHKNSNTRYHAKIHPPRLEGESVGVFATRSPHRPNPIGLSLVQIKEIKSDRIIFFGGDLVDGTPVLDIKPYLPQFESQPEALQGWSASDNKTGQNGINYKKITVEFTNETDQKIKNWMLQRQDPLLQQAIIEIIQQDPRPLVYKGYEQSISPYKSEHAFRLYNGDIHFKFLSENHAVVIDIIY